MRTRQRTILFSCMLTMIVRVVAVGASPSPPPLNREPGPNNSVNLSLKHWAFAAPRREPPPEVHRTAWPKNPVDRFILHRLEAEGFSPAEEAPRGALLRRMALDLTGLPPSDEILKRFGESTGTADFERIVDALMATRAYAERQAQDWLDLARYADTNGFADDQARAIWPYRDWVIRAFEQNLPFDQFTIEQLAGDLIAQATIDQKIASAFHRNSPQAKGSTYPVEEYRLKGVTDRVNTTGMVWLGLTLACAECHDHKFDPISQRDYFALFALFNNVVHTGEGFAQDGPSLKLPSEGHTVRRNELQLQIDSVQREIHAREATLSAAELKTDRILAQLKQTLTTRTHAREELDRSIPNVPVMQELPTPRETQIHLRGNFLTKGPRVVPGVPTLFQPLQGPQPTNRLQFARWLVDGQNPLVARVTVNRLWQSCFGQGLVRTPTDFGHQGALPSHPELLDWLACELVESGWNLRHIHKLILTSATYLQSARSTPTTREHDPQNLLVTRAHRNRLPAEQLRDQALAVAELLELDPPLESVFPNQPANYWEERALPGKWVNSSGANQHRRSLYTYWRRMALHPTLELLDAPARTTCTVRRTISNVPTQALVTLNDPIFVEAAQSFAKRLLRVEPLKDDAKIDRAFEWTLCRKPAEEERIQLLKFVASQRNRSSSELDCWTSVAAVFLNLDEFLCRP